MGTFQVEVEIGDPTGERWERVRARAGTQAVFMQLPSSLLEASGIEPYDVGMFRHPDGNVTEEAIGHVSVRIGGRESIAIVVFAEEGREPIVGWNTLDGLQLEADTESERLVPKELLMISHAS